MSVAQLTPQELACFVAICHKQLKAGPVDKLAGLMELASHGNAGAFSAQYGEPMEAASAAEIAAIAAEYLDDRRDMVADHFGPIAYNMISNNGRAFVAPGVETTQDSDLLNGISALEQKARKWQEGQQRAIRRSEENAVAYNEVGQLPTLTKDEIDAKMRAAGCERIIVAEFHVDESDLQSDYWGGRTGRMVVIGFGRGKRENFRQFRKAAGQFPPTAHMGVGKDIYTCRVVFTNDVVSNGCAYWNGSYSHWHQDEGDGATFETLAEAEAFIASKDTPHELGMGEGKRATFAWNIEHGSYEHRENYSMGGGNYLGTSRYGGWKVRSQPSIYGDRCEVFGI